MLDIKHNKASKYISKILGNNRKGFEVVGSVESTGPEGKFETIILTCTIDNKIRSYLAVPLELDTFLGRETLSKVNKALLTEIADMYTEKCKEITLGCYDTDGLDINQINDMLMHHDVSIMRIENMNSVSLMVYMRYVFTIVNMLNKYCPEVKIIDTEAYLDEGGVFKIFASVRDKVSDAFKIVEFEITPETGNIRSRFSPELAEGCLKKIKATLIMKKQLAETPHYILNLLRFISENILKYEWKNLSPVAGQEIMQMQRQESKSGEERVDINPMLTIEGVQNQLEKIEPYLPDEFTIPTIKSFKSIYQRKDVCLIELNIPLRNEESYIAYTFLLPFEDYTLEKWIEDEENYDVPPNSMVEFLISLVQVMTDMNKITWAIVRDLFGLSTQQEPPRDQNLVTLTDLHSLSSYMSESSYALVHKLLQKKIYESNMIELLDIGYDLVMYSMSQSENSVQVGYGVDINLDYYYSDINLGYCISKNTLIGKNCTCRINNWAVFQAAKFREQVNNYTNKEDADFVKRINLLFFREWKMKD